MEYIQKIGEIKAVANINLIFAFVKGTTKYSLFFIQCTSHDLLHVWLSNILKIVMNKAEQYSFMKIILQIVSFEYYDFQTF